ncbi:MAG: BamA/TamA family outer membrane protein [Saprospiraceae bacterium]
MDINAQSYALNLTSPTNKTVTQWQRDQPRMQDSISWLLAKNNLFIALHQEGHLLAQIPRWEFIEDTLYVNVVPGPVIHWSKVSFKALEYLPQHWVHDLDISGDVVDYHSWKKKVIEVLKAAESEGYLFANYKLNVIALRNDSLEASIIFDPGLQIIFDSIEIAGSARLSKDYLNKIFGLKRGEPITPNDIVLLQQQLNNLRFVQQKSLPVLILVDEKATIRVYLDNRNASAFDILAGLQPANNIEKKITLTGYVKLDLINQLARGERIYLHLEKLRPRSQELEMSLSYPYLLDLPFGVEGEFGLLKNDTLYSELLWKAGIVMPLGKNQFIRAGITQQATNLISVDKNRIIATKRLPAYIDLRIKGFTLGLVRNRLDFELNPRKGYSVSVDGSFSQKRVRRNNLIEDLSEIDPSFDYASLYDTLTEPVSRVAIEGAVQYFIPWGKRSAIRLAVDAGAIESGNNLFTNEMYRLGGYARLRGFDEESILAQYYSIFSVEYRLIISGGSYVSLFSDYAWIKNKDVDLPFEDRPFGFGLGLTLETKSGIFGMRAAVGAQQGNAIDFGNARLHFGYINRF